MPKKAKQIIALDAPVCIAAAAADADGKSQPATFTSTFYTGGSLEIAGWEYPVVVDLEGLQPSKVLVANLDHDRTKRVGNFEVQNDGKSLIARGKATAATAARDEVVQSAADGYEWQASLEVTPLSIEEVASGKQVTVNGQTFSGPLYVTRTGKLKGFAFVSHGADDNTSATIAAAAANKEKTMDPALKAWIESMGFSIDELSAEQLAGLEANFAGKPAKKKEVNASEGSVFERRKLEAKRRKELREIADGYIDRNNCGEEEICEIEKMYAAAVETKMTPTEFRLELWEASMPQGQTIISYSREHRAITSKVLEAAVCEAGRLENLDKHFTDKELQTAHDHFPDGISLNQLFLVAAEMNGYRGNSGGRMNLDVQRAAFRLHPSGRQIHAAGFSTIDVANIVAATANKFLHEGWMAVDQTCLDISTVRPVRNFQQITTVSLTGALQYNKIGADGEIKHGTLDDLTYTNQADTYASMLAITRKDIINDDLGALTAVPRRLGRGGMLKLNDIFWTEFLGLVGASFFAAGNNNINTGVADMTIGGLAATETIFMNQTDPDGKPLAIMPEIILVPTALKATAVALTDQQSQMTGGSSNVSTANPFRGRFTVESSPYISNSSYTGYTSVGWWMLANPRECAVIEIAALNGRIEPIVDTADADFNVLGVQMRGYCDIGVNEQEKRGGVYADGGSS